MNTAIIPTSQIQGDITSCKIESSIIKTEKDSMFSFQQIDTYRSYDVCTKQTINEYTVPAFTEFGSIVSLLSGIFGLVVLIILIGAWSES